MIRFTILFIVILVNSIFFSCGSTDSKSTSSDPAEETDGTSTISEQPEHETTSTENVDDSTTPATDESTNTTENPPTESTSDDVGIYQLHVRFSIVIGDEEPNPPTESLTVVGYGDAKGRMLPMVEQQARTAAMQTVAEQVAGVQFTYTPDYGTIHLEWNTQTTLSGVLDMGQSVIPLPDGSYHVIAIKQVTIDVPVHPELGSIVWERTQQVDSFSDTLTQWISDAIHETLADLNKTDEPVIGTLYYLQLDVSGTE
jgi:hypothetical protein